MKSSISKNIFKIFSGTLVSRITGLVRDQVQAYYFGTSKIADAFSFALTFPNLFRQILGEDMVERAFMPPFKTIYDMGEVKASWKLLSVVLNWFFLLLLIGMTLLYLIIPLAYSFTDFLPENVQKVFTSEEFDYELALKLIFILLPFMVFIGLAAFVGSLLNFFEKNWIYGFAPVMLSIGVIFGITVLYPVLGAYSLAVGYLLGAFLQLIIHLPFLMTKSFKAESKIKYYPKLKLADEDSRHLGQDLRVLKRESKIITLTALFNKSPELTNKIIASMLKTGSLSSLYYAQRFYQLPFAIISLSIVRGINPILNKMKVKEDTHNFNRLFNKGEFYYLLVLLPVTAFTILAAKDIITLILGFGKFSEKSIIFTSSALQMYAFGLIPMSLLGYYNRILSLFNKNKCALQVAVVGAILNISLAIGFINFFEMDHSGIALASSISFLINAILIRRYLLKDLKKFFINQKISKSKCFSLGYLLLAETFILLSDKIFDYDFESFLGFSQSRISLLLILILKGFVVFSFFIPLMFFKNFRKELR